MKYKISIKNPRVNINDDTDRRGPTLTSIQEHLKQYSVGFNGIIVLHHSMYDYQYEIKYRRYYVNVDSSGIIGHIEQVIIEGDTIYLIAQIDDLRFDITKDYICTYRAMMQTDPANDKELMMVNLFSVDLILIQPDEKTETMTLSSISEYEEDFVEGDLTENGN